ncbi:hypothetical protein CR513_28243, partial [Mucuna pruriens]
MTRSSSESLHAFDPEIERTLHRLRKVRHTITHDSSSSNSIWNSENSNFSTEESNFFKHQEAGTMENNDRTLKELATLDVVYQPWCIQCPPLEPAQSYELKSSLIHLLPKFSQALKGVPRGLFHEEAIGDTGRPHQDERVSILSGWIYKRLPVSIAGSLQYLGDMKRMFLEKFFPMRFVGSSNTLARHCMNTRRGLMMMDQSMIDATSEGALMDKTPAAARHLISNMASNTQ